MCKRNRFLPIALAISVLKSRSVTLMLLYSHVTLSEIKKDIKF